MTDANTQLPAADWYPDPSGSGLLRFWDGSQWTHELRPREQAVAQLDAGQQAPSQGQQLPEQLTPGQQVPEQQTPGQQHAHSAQASFFHSLFDLSFAAERSVTTSFVKVIYVLGIAISVLSWLGAALLCFILGGIESAAYAAMYSDGGGTFFILGGLVLIFGWIPGLFNVIFLRVGLEFVTAQIRTSQHTAELVRLARADA